MSEELKTLLEQCEEKKAIILSFNLYNEVAMALIEIDNAPMSLLYDTEDKIWK